MIKLKKETIKTLLLLLLIIASGIQLGIHWNQQVQGFPFRFISAIFNNNNKFPTMDVESLKYRYFLPEDVIVSTGPTASLWKLDQNDPYFISIWNDIKKNYLPAMIKQKPTKILAKDEWTTITAGRCIRIDFTVNWPSDIIFWLEDSNSREFKAFNSVSSIAILPQTDINDTVNTVFVYDENQVYQYQINLKEDFLPKKYYKGLADELSSQNKPRLSELSSAYPIFESQEDIFVSNRGDGSEYPTLKIEIPPHILLNKSNIENDSIQDYILLNQKDSLMGIYDETVGEEVLFTDTENLYTLSKEGVLEYRYLPLVNNVAGTASGAFSKALSFIELRRSLLGNAGLVLTKIDKTTNYYELHFEYQYDGVYVYYSGIDSKSRITSPLVIKASSERVLECQWVIRSFSRVDVPKKYSLDFTNLVNKQIQSLYPEILERERKIFQRIEAGYVFGLKDLSTLTSAPSWIISTDLKDYFIPLLEEGG